MISARHVAFAFSLTGWFCVPVSAQTLSAADILAKVEEKVGGVNEYQALLNDPDPIRSMAAMEVMLEAGDPKLMRMAMEFGIYSPNPVVRHAALKAFLDSAPLLRLSIDGSKLKNKEDFRPSLSQLNGSVDSNMIGFAAMKIHEYDAEKACYTFDGYDDCFVRLSETEVSIRPWRNQWYKVTLNDQGQLVGEVDFEPPAALTIPVTN